MQTVILFTAEYFLYVVALAVGIYWLLQPKPIKLRLIRVGVVAGCVALVLTFAANHLYYDPRPFVSHHFTPLVSHPADNGFPSDHTTVLALASFGILIFSRPVGIVLLVCTLLVGSARVMAGVHSPLDIVGSIVIAAISAGVAYVVERRVSGGGS